MAPILLCLFIAIRICHVDMNWKADAKVDSVKENITVPTSECGGKTAGHIYDLQNCVWNGSLSGLQQIHANEDIVYHRAGWFQTEGKFFGIKASLNVYKLPNVGAHQVSSCSIILANVGNTSLENFNGIEAGWHIAPELYGDGEPHFYIDWMVTAKNAGCFNLRCKGFLYMDPKIFKPGSRIAPVSSYNGPQYEITVTIAQDRNTGDWWVRGGTNGEVAVGYWPKALLPNIVEGAKVILYGGAVSYPRGENGPPMGSGHFPEEGSRKAAFVKNVMVLTDGSSVPPPNIIQDKEDCYRVGYKSNKDYFGGPGGCVD